MNMIQAKDLATAATPVVAWTSLSQINEIAGLVATLLGIAYLLWRWRRQWNDEHKKHLD
jgi:hypothetical protein